jgi:hypothetical protein
LDRTYNHAPNISVNAKQKESRKKIFFRIHSPLVDRVFEVRLPAVTVAWIEPLDIDTNR